MRISVIGAGAIGRKHARLIESRQDCALAGLCDVDAGRSSVAAEFNVPFYQDVQELLEQQNPDAAVIATPNGNHAPVAEVCLATSVDVLIEKPIADTRRAAMSIIEAADNSEGQVLVGHHRRHNPLIQESRSIVADGTIGKLVGVSILWALLKPADYFDVEWRCKRPAGGPTLINLIHEIDSLRFICGEIRQVYAQASFAARGLDVEDSLSVSLCFESGAMGNILASDATPAPWSYELTTHENPDYFVTDENCYHFLGTQASFTFPRMEIWGYLDATRMGWQQPLGQVRRDVTRSDPLVSQLEHFCRVIRREERPIVDARDGAQSLAVATAILESIDRRVPIDVPLC